MVYSKVKCNDDGTNNFDEVLTDIMKKIDLEYEFVKFDPNILRLSNHE